MRSRRLSSGEAAGSGNSPPPQINDLRANPSILGTPAKTCPHPRDYFVLSATWSPYAGLDASAISWSCPARDGFLIRHKPCALFQRGTRPVALSSRSGGGAQPRQIINFFASIASSARFAASCCSHSFLARGLASCGTSPIGPATISFFESEVFLRGSSLASTASLGALPSPSQATWDPGNGASQIVPDAQHPVSATATKTHAIDFAIDFGIITAPASAANEKDIPLC